MQLDELLHLDLVRVDAWIIEQLPLHLMELLLVQLLLHLLGEGELLPIGLGLLPLCFEPILEGFDHSFLDHLEMRINDSLNFFDSL